MKTTFLRLGVSVLLVTATANAVHGMNKESSSASNASSSTVPSVQELIDAVCDGNVQKVLELIGKNTDIVNAQKSFGEVAFPVLTGWTALMSAAAYGNKKIINILIAAGADVNAQNSYGFTALMLAAECCSIGASKALIKATIKADKSTNDPQAVDTNTETHFFDMQNNDGNTALHQLVKCAVNSYSPLLTVKINSLINIMIMLRAGADPMIKNNDGKTPVDLAVDGNTYNQLSAFADYFREKRQMVVGDRLAAGERYMIRDVAKIVGEY